MGIVLLINLYISRLVLSTLGIVDYGIYNVVGGFVSLFSILSASLSGAISRFLTFALGEKDPIKLNDIFCTSLNIQIAIASIIFILCETIGVWFLNTQMNIPTDRSIAANWIFQFSILTFIIGIISVPYNALIVAHEKMGAFALISVIEVFLKLVSIIYITTITYDKLISYGFLLMMISILLRIIYGFYSSHHFPESKYHLFFNKKHFLSMGKYAGWLMIGDISGILKNQGINILFNIFWGAIINAANAIAMQVVSLVGNFYGNFLTAVNPQIIKLYADKDLKSSYSLVKQSSRIAFLLMLIVAMPFFWETDFVLRVWLNEYPEHASIFVKLVLVVSMIEVLSFPTIILQRATGVMKNYQLVVGTIHLLNFPIAWILLYFGYPPESVFYIAIILAIINLFARLYMLRRIIPISICEFCYEVLCRVLFVTICTIISIHLITKIISPIPLYNIIIAIIISLFFCICLGLNASEINKIYIYIKNKFSK